MRTKRSNQRSRFARRDGTVALEVVMTTAVMLPLAGLILFLGIEMCSTIYQAMGALVAWPFL
jgi:hypothetical protein